MIPVKGYAAQSSTTPLAPWNFNRRELGEHDVYIEILYCGVCHSDIHQARNEWNSSNYPMVPGDEIIGRVIKVGNHVKKFKTGDLVGVGVIIDSCRNCGNCKRGLEQYCKTHTVFTYNSFEMDERTPTYGGYSNQIVITENFVLNVSDKLSLAGASAFMRRHYHLFASAPLESR